jgi:FlaA1/EpsC-like NDP-sugar epimerase
MSYRNAKERHAPKWVIATIDTFIVLSAFLLTSLLVNDFRFKTLVQPGMLYQIPILLAAYWTGFIIFKTYYVFSRSIGLRDFVMIFFSVLTGALIIFISDLILKNLTSDRIHLFSLSVLVINVTVTLYLMILSRLTAPVIYKKKEKALIQKLHVQPNRLKKSSLVDYPAELLVFNTLN